MISPITALHECDSHHDDINAAGFRGMPAAEFPNVPAQQQERARQRDLEKASMPAVGQISPDLALFGTERLIALRHENQTRIKLAQNTRLPNQATAKQRHPAS